MHPDTGCFSSIGGKRRAINNAMVEMWEIEAMDRLTLTLIAVAVGLRSFAARDARQARPAKQPMKKPATTPPKSWGTDRGMMVLRNDHRDDGMVVRSPFRGDPGIVPSKPSSGTERSDG
jgi:hypothetical protein